MPFDEEEDDQESNPKKGLKKVSSQKSVFDGMPKKPTQVDLDSKVKNAQDRASGYKQKAAEYSSQFKKMMSEKTLLQNRSVFTSELEGEILGNMIKLAVEVNNDPHEQEGMGSLMWIVLLLKTFLMQRDRINQLEYIVSQLEKKLDPAVLDAKIIKEINQALDKHQNNE